jgi:hypothetical protein
VQAWSYKAATMLIGTGKTLRVGAVIAASGFALVVLEVAGLQLGQANAARAASRSISVNEHAQVRLVSHHSGVLYEQGSFAGTPGGGLSVWIRLSYTEASITFTSTPSGGTLSGGGHASFYAEGLIAHFSGSVAINHGTGRYSGSAGALRISGTFQRKTYAMSLTVVGKLNT